MTEPLMPHSEEAEGAVVGSILIDNGVLPEVMALVSAEDFYRPEYRVIFEAEVRMGKGIDYVTLVEELRSMGKLDAAGGESTVARLLAITHVSFHAMYYAQIVAGMAVRRRVMHFCAAGTQRAHRTEGGEGVDDLLDWFSRGAMEVCLKRGAGGPTPIKEVASRFYDTVEKWAATPLAPGEVRGLSSGLYSLDALLQGMQSGELIMIAARPSMGKSTLAFEMARRVAEAGGRVLIVSLEMSEEQVIACWASALSGVPVSRMVRGACPEGSRGTAAAAQYVDPDELARYLQAVAEVAGYPSLAIDDRGALSTVQIRAAALSQAARMGGLDLVVVDHTGLIAPPRGGGYATAAKQEGQKSRELKALAKELEAPVLLVQQLSRGLEMRSDKRPQLSDLRDSGEHEENADVVLGLYWAGYYKQGLGLKDDKLEVSCLKHRRAQARVKKRLRYERALSRFGE